MTHFDPEAIDLAHVARRLREVLGSRVEGAIVGRTRMRDQLVQELGCSQLDAERVVDTLIGRGFVVRSDEPNALASWVIADR